MIKRLAPANSKFWYELLIGSSIHNKKVSAGLNG